MVDRRPARYPRHHRTALAVVIAVVVVAAGVTWGVLDARDGSTGTPVAGGDVDRDGTAGSDPAATGPVATGPAATGPAATGPVAAGPAATGSATVPLSPGAWPVPGIDLTAHSTTDPDSPWVVVNKQHPISPLDYQPADLVTVDGARVRQVVEADLQAMLAAAERDGVLMGLRTGYRSYGAQAAIRADVEARRGFDHAERYSARPGYSEHQTGLAFDLHGTSQPGCDLQTCFGATVEGRWVAAHAADYGFLVRYTPQNTEVTGYSPEAWHLRYVGRELAGWMVTHGIGSLEEALGVTGGSDYVAGP